MVAKLCPCVDDKRSNATVFPSVIHSLIHFDVNAFRKL